MNYTIPLEQQPAPAWLQEAAIVNPHVKEIVMRAAASGVHSRMVSAGEVMEMLAAESIKRAEALLKTVEWYANRTGLIPPAIETRNYSAIMAAHRQG